MSYEILTPPGRIVWGHPMQKTIKTDPKTRKPILNKEGKEQDVWSFGLAIPVAQFAAVEAAIVQAAYAQYPQGNFPRDFAWKVKRETDMDENNQPYSLREGYAGHVVLSISTQAFCPSVYKFENGKYRQLAENEIKCGDWVVAKLIINSHPGGVYLNPGEIELVGYDKEIQRRSAADPSATFGGRTYQLPPGVSAIPVAPSHGVAIPQAAPVNPSTMPPAGQQYMTSSPAHVAPVAYQPPAAPAGYAPPAPAGYMPPPATDFVQNAGQHAPAPAGYAPPAPAGYMPPQQPPAPVGYAPPAPAGHVPGVMPGR